MKNDKETLDKSFGRESRESNGKADFQERLDRYKTVKSKALDIAEYLKKEPAVKRYPGLQTRMETCGSLLQFKNYYEIDQIRLSRANFCEKHLLCPFCALRRGSKYARLYSDKITRVIDQSEGSNLTLVTLTIKNGISLGERFGHLEDSITKMINQRRMALNGRWKKERPELAKVKGGVFSFEIKRGMNSGQWHPHIHALMIHDAPLHEDRLSQDWRGITGDSHQVDVTPCYGSDYSIAGLEVFAYALKFSTMDKSDLFYAFRLLKGKRFIRSFGAVRAVKEPNLLDDPIEDQPFFEMLYKFSKEHGYLLNRIDKTLNKNRSASSLRN